ncbi:transmembrane protein 143-like [Gigantopelta aegis]|uniref:transmembrane protein 143-like n=1 Tax=Gigantopelta aegis TaxID=1735272 RepID=UPI001B889742|nr:transmembrane protein 143-like [Gigantopelta aegis]
MAASLLCRRLGILSHNLGQCRALSTHRFTSKKCIKCLCGAHYTVRKQSLSLSVRALSTTPDMTPDSSAGKTTQIQPVEELPQEEDLYKERYIPITRRSVIRHLMQQEDFLNDKERKIFDDFALALDAAIVNKYHGILQELKIMFDPINPDKDTIQTRQWSRHERLDNEFWLLQSLEDVMQKANFHELSRPTVIGALEEHQSREGVRVSVNPDKYDILKFWALGKEAPEHSPTIWDKVKHKVTKKPFPKPVQYYKRVVVALRLKKDTKLMLKAFKEIPVNNLEMLLPDGSIQMSTLDKGIVSASVFIAAVGVLTKVVTLLAGLNIDWMLVVTTVTGLIGVRAWTVYKNRRNAYLVDMLRTLYFKNIANNRGLLTLLVDRAEDESFKEALLVYTFLLTNRPPSAKSSSASSNLTAELGGLSSLQVERMIEDFLRKKSGITIDMDATEAIRILQGFGLASEKNEKLFVLPLEAAMRILPQQPQSVIARAQEADIAEGFDRDEYLETEAEYTEEEEKARKYGWF